MATGSTPDNKLQDSDLDELSSALEGLDDKGKGDTGDKDTKGEEEKTEEEKAAEAKAEADAERLKPVEKEDGTMETEDEAKARVETEDAKAAEPTETQKLTEEMKDLRQILRTSKREQVQLQAKISRLEKRPVKAEEEGEEEEEEDAGRKKVEVKEEPLSRVEELQGAIGTVGKERGAALDILLETMEQGAYKDIREVCSRGNFDDLFEVIATEASKEGGKDYDETLLEVELSVWSKENPYKYMYDLIRKYHPSYTKKEEVAGPGNKGKKVVADAPGSIADKGGDSSVKSGWTAKRIDDMSEDELDSVPKDVYAKYMLGELK